MTALLLNIAHAIDHLLLLVFATAVGAIAADFGIGSWESLMPYATGAFFMFGLGSLPSGRLGDLWGRRAMMLVFFFGIGLSSIAVAFTTGPWSMAVALTLVGCFASIYHPVGIPMLIQSTRTPGKTIGINGLSGNLGIAFAALLTGFLVQMAGWRAAFVVPGLIAIVCGVLFMRVTTAETVPPARRAPKLLDMPESLRRRVLMVMLMTAITGSLAFNLTTNGNAELLKDRLPALATEPARLGALLALHDRIARAAAGRPTDRCDADATTDGDDPVAAALRLRCRRADRWLGHVHLDDGIHAAGLRWHSVFRRNHRALHR